MKNYSEVMKYSLISTDFIDMSGMVNNKMSHEKRFNGKKNESEATIIIQYKQNVLIRIECF
jgi:hypothetical protein